MNLIQNEYRFNTNFKKYVDEFCKVHGCTKEDAFEDDNVKKMFWRYTEV